MKTVFTSLFLGFLFFGSAQNTFKIRSYAPVYSYLNQVVQLNDGSLVGTGVIERDFNEEFNSDIYLLKTDAKGTLLTSKAMSSADGDSDDGGYSIIKTSDGGLAVCGLVNDQAALLKFKADLTLQWQKTYHTESDNNITTYKVVQTTGGEYLMAGYINNSASGIAGYLLKTDSQGNIMFSKQYFNYAGYVFYDIASTNDGNYAILAVPDVNSSNDSSFIIKIKPDGSILWAKSIYSSADYTEPYAITSASDGGIVVTGDFYSNSTDDTEDQLTLMMKFNGAGTLLWSKQMITSGISGNFGNSVAEDKDGGYLFAGALYTYRDLNSDYDSVYAYVVKTNALGVLQWTRTFDKVNYSSYTELYNIITTDDGGYVTCGEGTFYDAANDEENDGSTLYKFNSSFQTCGEIAGSNGTIQNIMGVSGPATVTSGDVAASAVNISVIIEDAGEIEYPCNALPLQLLTFNAMLQNKSVSINWKTANEVNTDYFVVERSGTGNAFTALQKIAAKGNSNLTQTYTTNDLQPLPGTSYYRLQQVDKDGKTTYSSVVPIVVMSKGAIVISPNPVQSSIRVIVQSNANSHLLLQVADMKGNVLATQKSAVATGRNDITIPAASLATGVYILKVIENSAIQTLRFVKE